MASSLLTTKLSVPPLRPDLVPRPRLVERLDGALRAGRGLVLVAAPAGFGKSTVVVDWLHSLRRRGDAGTNTAWLALDEADSDPARFHSYLLAALASAGLSVDPASQLSEPQARAASLAALLNEIGAAPSPLVLVLDDYHLVQALSVHQQVAFLLEHRPPQLHVVIASREDPPLPLGRLRASGQVVEIRQADLEFSHEEAAAFLQRALARELSAADVAALHDRTEGWAAGLQLAALSIRDHEDPHRWLQSFAGSHRYVLDYLVEEVMRHQTEPVQGFLLRTSILDHLTPSLCDAVTETEDSQAMLLGLERANLFIVPLDELRSWYRYHHLFADVLRHRLHAERASEIPGLHRRASEWYADHGYRPDAVRHALAGSDWDRAAELILRGTSAELLQRGELMTLLGWFGAFPEPIVRASPQLCCEYAWPLILTGQIEAAGSYIDRAAAVDEALVRQMLFEQSGTARRQGGHVPTTPSAGNALALLPPDRLPERGLVLLNLAMARWYQGRLAEAEEMLAEARAAARRAGDTYSWLTASIFIGKALIARGKLRQAATACAEIIGQNLEAPIAALAHYDLASLRYEWNDLEAAADCAAAGLGLCDQSDCGELQLFGLATLAYIRQAQGQSAEAAEALRRASEIRADCSPSPAGRLHLQTSRIVVALGQGDLETAGVAVEQVPAPEEARSVPNDLQLCLAKARYQLAKGRRREAAGELAALYETAQRTGWRIVTTRVRALQALAAVGSEQALPYLAESLALAEPAGHVRTYLDLGEPMRALLGQCLTRGILVDYAARLLGSFAVATGAGSSATGAPSPGTIRAAEPAEALSERELEVLRLLAGGLSNQELADQLFISGNTVKTHLASIYGKLAVGSRREAVSRARMIGLLP